MAGRVAVHRRVAYLPSDLELHPRLTGRQHIDWFARSRGGVDHGFVRRLLDLFAEVADRLVRELPKGDRQKIAIALAFMQKPDLLVLEEPTSGLDPLIRHEFENLLRETAGEGRTVFLSSHELDEVQRIADRIAIIREGRLVAEDTVLRGCAERRRGGWLRFRRPGRPGRSQSGGGRHGQRH